MSRVVIISYELSVPGRDYSNLLARIKSFGAWAKLGSSVYLVFTAKSVVDVRNHLKPTLQRNDKLFVGTCPSPAAWTGMSDNVSRWIHKHQSGKEA